MYKDSTTKYISDTLLSLKEANVSIYKISKILDEPEPTLHNILKSKGTKYSEDRVISILARINEYLNPSNDIDADSLKSEVLNNIPTYTKLFEVGLNSRAFTPEEKLYMAQFHQKLMKLKNQNPENENPN